MITRADAILSLRPGAEWAENADGIHWFDLATQQPTEAEINDEVVRLQAEYEATAYKYQRATEYPDIGDQLDALWKGGDAAAEMLAKVQAVKAKYPKEQA